MCDIEKVSEKGTGMQNIERQRYSNETSPNRCVHKQCLGELLSKECHGMHRATKFNAVIEAGNSSLRRARGIEWGATGLGRL